MRMAVICKKCWQPTRFHSVAPKLCPKCHKDPEWMVLTDDEPEAPYRETRDDALFLESIHVKPEVPSNVPRGKKP